MTDTTEDSLEKSLAARFVSLWQRCLRPDINIAADQAWREIVNHYSESHRRYHTLGHIEYCLRELDDVRYTLEQADAIEMAIWYHDIINMPEDSDNEHQSRRAFAKFGTEVFDPQFVSLVEGLIMATTHRTPPATPEQAYICDIDLSSLGAAWSKFMADGNDLWTESESAPEEYALGKLAFFESLLARPRIFYSDHFHQRYEDIARDNIRRFIAILGQD